jgi:DNA-binding LacI/PurR family transcriptional regulator
MEPDKVRAPNIRDVARLAGVSYQTVSREIDYRPNEAARALVTSRSRTIGVLTSQNAHYGPMTSLTAIEHAARDAGYRITITSIASSAYPSIKVALDQLQAQAVEAIVVIAPQVRVLEVIRDLEITVPYVTLQNADLDNNRSMSIDQVAGARMATQHLIDLGHTEIVHLSGPQDWIEAESRMRGYLDALDAADLRTRAPILGDWSAHFGYYAGLELLRFRDFTALFAGNDQMALGFMHACWDSDLTVPGDISVVGFDDIPEAAHFYPPLTTVRQNFTEIGRRAVSLLLAQLQGNPDDHTQVIPELMVRRSTAPPR